MSFLDWWSLGIASLALSAAALAAIYWIAIALT